MTNFFTGIGSRQTPAEHLHTLMEMSHYLVELGLRLRSGHAQGADRACETGAGGEADIYLPWGGYGVDPYRDDLGMAIQGNPFVPNMLSWPKYKDLAILTCRSLGMNWETMTQGVQKLLFRNMFQVLGHAKEKEVPSKLVICWTPGRGGTGYALKLAERYDVPIINLAEFSQDEAWKKLDHILETTGIHTRPPKEDK